MARYTGPKVRVSRRLGTNIFENEKGRRALERRPFPPGQHGRTRRRNNASEYLLRLLELRLDNIVYRAGWASTRPQARQFVNHGLIHVNGKRVDIASARVRKGDVVSLSPKSRGMIVIQHNIDTLDRSLVGWLQGSDGGKA